MAGLTRLELATSGVTGQRSNQLNYNPALFFVNFLILCYPNDAGIIRLEVYGGLNGARTCDTRLVRPMLSQLSYQPLK